jgi:hypothetical protein
VYRLHSPVSGQKRLTHSSAVKIEAPGSSEVMVFINQTTKGHVPLCHSNSLEQITTHCTTWLFVVLLTALIFLLLL